MLVTCKFCKDSVFSPMMTLHMRQSHATCLNCLKGFPSDKALQEHLSECRPSLRHAKLLERVVIPTPEHPQQVQPPAPPAPAPLAPQPDVPEAVPIPVPETTPAKPVVHCPGRPHVCKYCDRDFQKLSHMHMHQSQKHRDKIDPSLLNNPVTCDQCDKEFASQADLEQHTEDAHQTKPAPEPEPAPPASVADPIPPQPPQPNHVCCNMPNCDFYGYIEEDLHKHLRWKHPLIYKYRCNRCAFVTDTTEQLGMHYKHIHLRGYIPLGNSMYLACDFCATTCFSWSSFFAHIRKHKTNKYPCNECKWIFCSPNHLNRHCVTTHDTRHYGCCYCLMDFNSNTELCAHVREHQIECIMCTGMFLTEDDINQHMTEEHPDNLMTIEQMRTEEEKRDLKESQKRKMEQRICQEDYHKRMKKEKKRIKKDRKRKTQPGTSDSSQKKSKTLRSKDKGYDEIDPEQIDDDDEDNVPVAQDDITKDPDYKPPGNDDEEDDDDDDDEEDDDDDNDKEQKELVE